MTRGPGGRHGDHHGLSAMGYSWYARAGGRDRHRPSQVRAWQAGSRVVICKTIALAVLLFASGSRGPSSSLLDGLGRVRRVKAKPADASRFASLDTTAAAKGWQLRGGRERYRNPQASARPSKRICKPDAARRAEAGKTTGMPEDGASHVCGGGQRCMRPTGTAETGVVRLITQRSQVQILPPLPSSRRSRA